MLLLENDETLKEIKDYKQYLVKSNDLFCPDLKNKIINIRPNIQIEQPVLIPMAKQLDIFKNDKSKFEDFINIQILKEEFIKQNDELKNQENNKIKKYKQLYEDIMNLNKDVDNTEYNNKITIYKNQLKEILELKAKKSVNFPKIVLKSPKITKSTNDLIHSSINKPKTKIIKKLKKIEIEKGDKDDIGNIDNNGNNDSNSNFKFQNVEECNTQKRTAKYYYSKKDLIEMISSNEHLKSKFPKNYKILSKEDLCKIIFNKK
jgi:hypothetical protein